MRFGKINKWNYFFHVFIDYLDYFFYVFRNYIKRKENELKLYHYRYKWHKVIDPDDHNGNFCPICHCGSEVYFKMIGTDMATGINIWKYRCGKCGWIGDPLEVLLLDEMKNIRRTELIDDILK